MLRLLNSLQVVAELNPFFREEALAAATDATLRAQRALNAQSDLATLRAAATFALADGSLPPAFSPS